METPLPLLLASPVDVLAAVPYLVGFHPERSLVVVGLTGHPPHGRVRVTSRSDLPLAAEPAGLLVPFLRREGVTQVILAGYGPGPLVTPAVDRVRSLAAAGGLHVVEALRADEGRYWSYVCAGTTCCPPEGTPYDPAASQVPASATVNGMVALPDRAALEASVAPAGGAVRAAMRAATGRAVAELTRRFHTCRDADGLARDVVADGIAAVHAAVDRYAAGGRLDDDAAARLGLALAVVRVRDEAWTSIDQPRVRAHLALWRDLTRRLEPRFTAPAASLLGLSAWLHGDCALAAVALARALEADPGYSMAALLTQALQHLVSPEIVTGRMPSPADLDEAMGPPRMPWLLPLLALLDEPAGLTCEGTGGR